jgi:phosphoribosylformimino-5-aminoimidazole carboxamide ribotide isomerase
MEIIPAIDLRAGKCVRLTQGDYNRETVFGDDPVAIAQQWEALGATRLHVIDLEGAKEGEPRQLEVVAAIIRAVKIPIELGGGIRSEAAARQAINIGVDRVIMGTAALDGEKALRLHEMLGESLAGGIDAHGGKVAVRGWVEITDVNAIDLARWLVNLGIHWIVYTDIGSDGMLEGANIPAMREMIEAVPKARIIASGGVTTVEDIRNLRTAGAAAAIVGMALYTGKLNLKAALEAAC